MVLAGWLGVGWLELEFHGAASGGVAGGDR